MIWLKRLMASIGIGPRRTAREDDRVNSQKPHVEPTQSWQERVRAIQLPPERRIPVTSLAATRPPPTLLGEDVLVALTQEGLSYGRAEDVAFVKAAVSGVEWPTGMHLRKHGALLSKDDLRAQGYRANLILSHECLAILTDKGREYPADAAQFIVSALNGRRSARTQIDNCRAVGLGRVEVYANSMAAGACKGCRALARKAIPLDEAPLGPLAECPHPSQCILIFRGVF